MDWDKIEHFHPECDEMLACPCCGKCEFDESFVLRLDHARELSGVPFVVLSGCRCEKHNKAVGGAENSAHLRGAVDIKYSNSEQCYKIFCALIEAGFERIGINNGSIHVDDDPTLPRPRLFNYYKKKK